MLHYVWKKHNLFRAWKKKWKCYLLSWFWLFMTLWTVAYQAPLSMGFQTRILELVGIPSSRQSSWPRDRTQVSCITGRFFSIWATREAQLPLCCYWIQVCVPDAQWGLTVHWDVTVWNRKKFTARPCKEISLQTLHSLKECRSVLKARWQGDVVGCCELPGVRILGSCSCPRESGHDVPKPSIRQVLVCILQLLSLLNGKGLHP